MDDTTDHSEDDDLAEYPSEGFPVVFADGLANAAIAEDVVKLYLYRHNPALGKVQAAKRQEFMQLVLTKRSFARAALFFDRVLKSMIEDDPSFKNEVAELTNNTGSDDDS